jgi:hypothetical protein
VDVGESVNGGRLRDARVVRGEVAVIPAGVPTLWRWGEQLADRLHLYLDPALLEGVAAEAGLGREGFEILDGLSVRDPLVEQVGLSHLSELESGAPPARSTPSPWRTRWRRTLSGSIRRSSGGPSAASTATRPPRAWLHLGGDLTRRRSPPGHRRLKVEREPRGKDYRGEV